MHGLSIVARNAATMSEIKPLPLKARLRKIKKPLTPLTLLQCLVDGLGLFPKGQYTWCARRLECTPENAAITVASSWPFIFLTWLLVTPTKSQQTTVTKQKRVNRLG
jgi:hypothetical protein